MEKINGRLREQLALAEKHCFEEFDSECNGIYEWTSKPGELNQLFFRLHVVKDIHKKYII